jgi:hypothetical protein
MMAPVFHFYAGAVDKHGGGTMPVAGGVEMRFPRRSASSPDHPSDFPLNIASWKLGARSSAAPPLSSGRRNCQSRGGGSSRSRSRGDPRVSPQHCRRRSSGSGWSSIWASRRSVSALAGSGSAHASASTTWFAARFQARAQWGDFCPLAGRTSIGAGTNGSAGCHPSDVGCCFARARSNVDDGPRAMPPSHL